jgi:protein ImuB
MLWLALHFPQLPIDRQYQADNDVPRAVVLQEGSRRRIMACNRSAASAGIKSGLALKNAYALAPNLITSDYNEDEQRTNLEQLCLTAMQYSSNVVPEPPDTIMVEIGASLRLFNGVNILQNRIGKDIQRLKLTLLTGIAPTASAASLFARTGINKAVTTDQELTQTLDTVPISCLPLDTFILKGLRQSGLQTLGELRRIPPAALTRRFGDTCTQLLYKLDGRLPDPKTPFQTQEYFSQAVDLPLEASDTNALAFALKRLLSALGGFLRARDLGIVHLQIVLDHHQLESVSLSLKFLDATADMTHLLRVATERLARVNLEAAVTRLALNSVELAPLQRADRDLFNNIHAQKNSIEQLLDKLIARLGKQSVYTAITDNDHRPEKAWMPTVVSNTHVQAQWPARPLWLLPEPQPLNEAVTLMTPPERIENGWWDELDVRRDYFIASNEQGSYFWIYRLRHQPEHKPEQWWIHGLFA